jgi:hypothetical protein
VPLPLAQLSPEEVGLVKWAISAFGVLFLGLVGWVATYMRAKAEMVGALDKQLGRLEQLLNSVAGKVEEHRPKVHKVGSLEQRLLWLEERTEKLEDWRHRILEGDTNPGRRPPT